MIVRPAANTYDGLRDRSGIALVVVLGMLAIMVLMGVAFSISMRTERLAASAFVDTVTARQLMDVALARVVTGHIPDSMPADSYYPTWRTSGGSGTNFLDGKGINYVPGALRADALAGDVIDWINVRDPSSEERFYGQYAFMIVNNSGLLDANVVAGSNRMYGAHPAEIQIRPDDDDDDAQDLLLEAQATGDLGAYRDVWFGRFDTVPELFALGSWSPGDITATAPFRTSAYVDHFHIFSNFRQDEYVSRTGPPRGWPKAFVGGPVEEWDTDAEIIEALTRQPNPPFDADEAADFLALMKDFAEQDPNNPLESYIPAEPDGLSFKRVPMINAIAFSNTVEVSAGAAGEEFTLRVHLFIETWFPFEYAPNASAIPFELRVNGVGIKRVLALPEPMDELIDELTLQGAETRPISPRHDGSGKADFRVTEFVYEATLPVNCLIPTDCPPQPTALGIELEIAGTIEVLLQGQPVNVVQPNWPDEAFVAMGMLPAGNYNATLLQDVVGQSAFDPRLNWDPQAFMNSPVSGRANRQWDREPVTLGTNNPAQATYETQSDEFGLMHCPQRPFRSVGDLSYLLYKADTPWQTVRILGPDPLESAGVIDRLTVHPTTSRKGFVNINTPFPPVLGAALYWTPIQPWEQTVGTPPRVTVDQATRIAQDISQAVQSTGGARNLSDLASLPGVNTTTIGAHLELNNPNKFEVESVIRNSMGMLGTRDTLFTIFLITRTFPRDFDPDTSPIPDGMDVDDLVAAQQRAVALVWRDPATDENGIHQTAVISFIWLPDFD